MEKNRLLYAEFICQGAGVLISWNAVLTAMDWFTDLYGEYNPSFILPICNFIACPFIQPLTIYKGHLFSFNKRIIWGFGLTGILLVMMPIFGGLVLGAAGFGLQCVLCFFIGAINSVSQTSVFGMTGMMPGEYMTAVMIGNAVAGIVLNIARIICYASFPQDSTGLLLGTTVYFSIAGGILILCCFVQLHMTKHPLVHERVIQAYIDSDRNAQTTKVLIGDDDFEMNKESVKSSEEFIPGSSGSYVALFKKIWVYVGLIFFTYITTIAIFPAVSIAAGVEGLSYPWFVILIVTTYNVFDALGRQAVSLYMLKPVPLIILTLSRLLFWMTTVMIAAQMPPAAIFGSAWFIFLNQALFAFTNGYYSTTQMIYGPAQVEGISRDKAGSIMSTSLVMGVFIGSVMSLMFTGVVKK